MLLLEFSYKGLPNDWLRMNKTVPQPELSPKLSQGHPPGMAKNGAISFSHFDKSTTAVRHVAPETSRTA